MTTRRTYTEAERQLLRERYASTPNTELAELLGRTVGSVAQQAVQLGLLKSSEHRAAMSRATMADPSNPALRTCFQPGSTPPNKGVRRPGWKPPSAWGPDNRPAGWQPVGSTAISTNGLLLVKVADEGPRPARWKGLHTLVWEQANGPVPPGHLVAFKAGRRTTVAQDIVLDALELVTMRSLIARNSFTNYPPELRDAMRLVGKIRRVIDERSEDHR